MKVHWATHYETGIANSLGYFVHNDRMRAALAATGVEFDESAPVAVHVCPPNQFEPIPGKRSIVSCAWEFEQLPEPFRVLQQAAVVCPTASFLVEPLQRFLPGVRVQWLSLGVNAERFAYVDRKSPKRQPFRNGHPFRFLWVGAPNARKGPLHLMEAWKAFSSQPGVELYLKTTVPEDAQAYVGLQRIGNVIYDTRKMPLDELVKLYQSAHAFVFPSQGEGFGLTLAEAMATGLPVIYTAATSMLDLAPVKELVGFPVQWSPRRLWLGPCDDPADFVGYEPHVVGLHVTSANPDTTDLARQMVRVLRNYDEAIERGYRAATRIRQRFTWELVGRRLRKIVESVYREVASGEAATASGRA